MLNLHIWLQLLMSNYFWVIIFALMNRKLLFVFVLSLTLFSSKAQYEAVFKLPYPQKIVAIDSIYNKQPITADSREGHTKKINQFKEIARISGDKIAMLIADLYSFTYLKQYIDEEQQAEEISAKLGDRAEEIKAPAIKAQAILHLGYYYFYYRNKESVGLYYLLKAYEIFSSLTKGEFLYRGNFLIELSKLFYRFNDNEKAYKFCHEAIQYPLLNPRDYLFSYNLMGMICLKLNKYDSAIQYFDKSLTYADPAIKIDGGLKGWRGLLAGNKAQAFEQLKKTEIAIDLYKFAIDTTNKYRIWDNTSGFAIGLANIYLAQNKTAELLPILQLAKTTTQAAGSYKDKMNLCRLLNKYYGQTGNFKEALLQKDSFYIWKDSVDVHTGYNEKVKAELNIEQDKRQLTELRLQKNIEEQRLYRTIAFVVLLLLFITGLMLYNRARLKAKIKEQKLVAEQEKVKQELQLAKAQLEEFAHTITEKNKLLEIVEKNTENIENSKQIDELRNFTILTEDQWTEFRSLFEKVHIGFYSKLKEKLPDLTPAEIRVIMLSKLNLNNKEMGASLGVSATAIRMTWHRLRKKINLPEEASLEDWFRSLEM